MRRWLGIVAATGCLLCAAACRRHAEPLPAGQPPAIRLGVGLESVNSLTLLADRQGLLAPMAAVTNYASGKLALGALLRGDVDIATAAQTPIVLESFRRCDLRIIAVVGSSDNDIRIVARKDGGVRTASDLRGKRIATQSLSSMHFFLNMYLLKQGVAPKEATVEFAPLEALSGLLESGKVAAVTMREPLIGGVVAALGANAQVFEEPGLYVKYYCLVATERVLREKAATVAALLRALAAAEDFARQRPGPAATVAAGALGVEPGAIRALWPDMDLRIHLPQALLLSLEDEARWMMAEGFTDAKEMPNYLESLDMGPLEQVKPEAITVIR